MKRAQKLVFVSYSFDADTKRIELHYELDEQKLTEVFELQFEVGTYNAEALERALFGLHIMAGVSYFKAGLPRNLEIASGSLTLTQARFFEETYRLGLGEFFYRNRLDIEMPIVFPAHGEAAHAIPIAGLSGSLVPIGGGKDSIVTAELLAEAGEDFVTWHVGDSSQIEDELAIINRPHLGVKRILDSKLLTLNQEGAPNGHVPISAILSFLGVACAILTGREYVVLSNEWSAGEGNVEYQGLMVNHQYSKSFAYEQAFQAYVDKFITPSVTYFSLLRPLSELKIAEVFADRYLERYRSAFSSCNRNFQLHEHGKLRWCGNCPKCAFVFLIFAPFVPKNELIELFGKNLFVDAKLVPTYQELLGLSGHKPFECVGEIHECRQAAFMARSVYLELEDYHFEDPKFDLNLRHSGAMPVRFSEIVRKI